MKQIILLFTLFIGYLMSSYAQPGELDPSFGNKGIVNTDFGFKYNYDYRNKARQVLLQPDGKMYVLVQAEFFSRIAKRLSDGSPDLSYGNAGISDPVAIILHRLL